MFIDYEFYTTTYGGTDLTSGEFTKYAQKACRYISAETMDRITDTKITNYPEEIQTDVKLCACALAEKYKALDKIESNIFESASGSKGSTIKSEKSGQASIEYGSSDSIINSFKDPNSFKKYLKKTFSEYICPKEVNGITYNLASKVLRPCRSCYL